MSKKLIMGLEWEVQVRLPSDTPVAGIELNPWVRVNYKGSYLSPPSHAVQFAWYRELLTLPKCVEVSSTYLYWFYIYEHPRNPKKKKKC